MYFLILHCVAAKERSASDSAQGTKRFSWEVLYLLNLAAYLSIWFSIKFILCLA